MTSRRLLMIVLAASFVVVDLDVDVLGGGRGLNTARVAIFATLLVVSLGICLTARPFVPLPNHVVLLLLWALVATAFGLHPARSLVAWFVLAAAAIIGSNHETYKGAPVTIWGIWLGSLLLTVGSVAADLFDLAGRTAGRLAGFTLEPNMLGHLAGLGLVTGFLIARDSNYRLLTPTPLFLYAILESGTRTIWPALLGAVFVLAWTKSRMHTTVAASLVILMFMAGGLETVATDAAKRSESENLSDLTGRPDIWRWSLDRVVDQPLTGGGLASGPAQLDATGFESGLAIQSPSSHSLPIEIARETGVIGLGFALMLLGEALRARNRQMMPLLAYLLVTAVTMPLSGFAGLVVVAWFAVVAASETEPKNVSPSVVYLESMD